MAATLQPNPLASATPSFTAPNTQNHSHGSFPNVTKLISTCAEMGTSESLDYARKAFDFFLGDQETKGILFMCNSLIRGYASAGLGDEAILPYVQMSVKGILPDKFTFPFSLSACSKIVAFYEGFSSMERL
ncbi:hypothetical protein ACFX2I_012481 [Malus domestica]